MQHADKVLGSNGRKALAHLLQGNRYRGDYGLSGFGNVLVGSLNIFNISLNGAFYFYQDLLNGFFLNMTTWKRGTIGEIPSFLATFYNDRVIKNNAPFFILEVVYQSPAILSRVASSGTKSSLSPTPAANQSTTSRSREPTTSSATEFSPTTHTSTAQSALALQARLPSFTFKTVEYPFHRGRLLIT